jgi:hypothetical protein
MLVTAGSSCGAGAGAVVSPGVCAERVRGGVTVASVSGGGAALVSVWSLTGLRPIRPGAAGGAVMSGVNRRAYRGQVERRGQAVSMALTGVIVMRGIRPGAGPRAVGVGGIPWRRSADVSAR